MDNSDNTAHDELRPEYDQAFLTKGIRGKYAERYAAATNVVRLAPDVATIFRNEEAVNEALRLLLRVMDDTNRLTKRCTGAEDISEPEDVGQFFSDSDRIGNGSAGR